MPKRALGFLVSDGRPSGGRDIVPTSSIRQRSSCSAAGSTNSSTGRWKQAPKPLTTPVHDQSRARSELLKIYADTVDEIHQLIIFTIIVFEFVYAFVYVFVFVVMIVN
jgi:hypothetical protein